MAKEPQVTSQNTNDGEDEEISPDAGVTIVKSVLAFKHESHAARLDRLSKNRRNRELYLGRQDYSEKQNSQSQEFIPKMPMAVEQMTAFVKRALVQFGDWFKVEFGKGFPKVFTEEEVRDLLMAFLNNIATDNRKDTNFATLMGDAIKAGLLESLIVLKVHGINREESGFVVEPGEEITDPETGRVLTTPETVVRKSEKVWRLRIDQVRFEDYYPDPTGRGLYEIHSVERDIKDVVAMAEAGVYDATVVDRILEDFSKSEDEARRDAQRNQTESREPSFRKRIVIDEFWGTLLDSNGRVIHENIVCAIANDRYVIRKPEPNPFWHQESPFVVEPLIRVPYSVMHKALMDHAAGLNIAMNELFNLMLDGGFASVWGVRQLHAHALDDPTQVSGGIPQGETLVVKDTLAPGQKVLEQVTEGKVPPDAITMFNLLNSEFAQASLSNELKLGSLPAKQVKATEIIEQSQSQAVTLDALAADIERGVIESTLHKAWLTIMQNADDLDQDMITGALGMRGALALSRLSKAQRFALFAGDVSFKASGLSNTMTKARDFQKMMALLQAATSNPLMLQAFFRAYSPDKILKLIMTALNVNPEQLERDETEQARLAEDISQMQQFMAFMSGDKNAGAASNPSGTGSNNTIGPSASSPIAGQDVGSPELPAEINQLVNPSTGFTGNA